MIESIQKSIKLIIFVLLAAMVLSVVNYVQDLRTRFPDMDFSKSRMGVASWYSETDDNINEKTANGEVFDDQKMTCASWYYPFGTKLLVINLTNGRWVVCRVNDRGPHKKLRREIDLTKAAFSRIARVRRGLILAVVIPIHKK